MAAATIVALGLGMPVAASTAQAQSLNQQGVARMNADAQYLWGRDGLPMADAAARAELQKLVGVPHRITDKLDATITKINWVALNCAVAPGLTRLDGSRIEGAAPLHGDWTISASADLLVKGKFLGIKIDRTYTIQVELRELKVGFRIDLDSTNPAAPSVVKLHPPTLDFKLKITTSSWVLNFLSWLTRSTVNGVGDAVAKVALQKFTQTMNVQYAAPFAVIGEAGGPGLDPVAPADLHGAAAKIGNEIFAQKLPWGTVVEGHFDRDYRGTWEDSLRDPAFTPGTLDTVAIGTFGDSALMTGYLLAGEAFRYGATRSPEAAARGRRLLDSFRTLLTMKGTNGDLNRSISPMRPGIQLGQDWYVKRWNGVDYAMCDYISRDAYTGTFVGLSTAHDLFSDPAMKQDAREQIEMAIDYLLANGWTHRKRDGSFGERWVGATEHQYAWVLAAHRVNPAKYAAALDAHKGYADILWCPIWLSCVDPLDDYFKFSLSTSVMYTALRLETDPVRWQRAYQGIAVLRHYIGHHQNAQFNNVYLALDAGSKARLGAENRNLMVRWLRQPRRYIIHDLRQDPTIEKITFQPPFDPTGVYYGASGGAGQAYEIAKQPIPVERRVSTGYRWSRSPVKLHENYLWGEEPRHEGEGVDYVLPYWMGRYYRVIPAPRPTPVTARPARAAAARATAAATAAR